MSDYHAFMSTNSGSDGGGGGGCSGKVLVWILVIYGILTLLGKLSGWENEKRFFMRPHI